ncbi:glycosyltransferase [Caulobacter sp. 1776]|uniref:glycosyltransferase n=1 Tax=Caulobacter sp. 1776 TaxID=3156420 RepID=UPI0033912B8D
MASTQVSPLGQRPTVAVMYHMFPHYRAPVLSALSQSTLFDFSFWAGIDDIEGIKVFRGNDTVSINPLRTLRRGSSLELLNFWKPLIALRPSTVILIGNPNLITTWCAAVLARLMGAKVLFWTHGWLKPESRLKAKLRNLYFSLADKVLVYGDRAVSLARKSGFDADKVVPIYNSLDWEAADRNFHRLEQQPPREEASSTPTEIVCTARITKHCRFDLLIQAANLLRKEGVQTKITLVGDGPERSPLEDLAKTLDVDLKCLGAIYDEGVIAGIIYDADITVSPGKVGLTAMHSLSYGTPVITHGDLDQQMPEVEAIVPGVTGDFFQADDVTDLARKIKIWIQTPRNREDLRQNCRKVMIDRYTPESQRRRIEQAIESVLHG